jgi:hypothetical protein
MGSGSTLPTTTTHTTAPTTLDTQKYFYLPNFRIVTYSRDEYI